MVSNWNFVWWTSHKPNTVLFIRDKVASNFNEEHNYFFIFIVSQIITQSLKNNLIIGYDAQKFSRAFIVLEY